MLLAPYRHHWALAPKRLSPESKKGALVLVPAKLYPASDVKGVSFRMIHKPSGKPIRYAKGVRAKDDTFTEVEEDEIVKGYGARERSLRPA